MAETTMPHADADEATLLDSIRKGMKELAVLRAEMKEDQEDIDRMQAENQIRLANIERILDRLAASR